eukprot:TRINITY_DN6864_c0_g1_i2.p1 TRINITY_DN6864_c0_g1~~TRINITY_DN6864_c0_g1_i2.p1  ORF type:complete len:101 (+),score=18.56 TRINITY_DN6864_c0_g1_i2:180-482(+)
MGNRTSRRDEHSAILAALSQHHSPEDIFTAAVATEKACQAVRAAQRRVKKGSRRQAVRAQLISPPPSSLVMFMASRNPNVQRPCQQPPLRRYRRPRTMTM